MPEELSKEVLGLSHRLGRVEGELTSVATRMRDVELQNAGVKAHKENVEFRLQGIEDSLRWVVRLIIGAIILGILAFALGGGFVIV